MKCGDIVLIERTSTDFRTVKIRPALIISPDQYNAREADRILVPISSNTARTCPDDVLIEKTDKSFSETGLKVTSAMRTGKILTAHTCLIKRILGHLSDEAMNRVKTQIKKTLDLT